MRPSAANSIDPPKRPLQPTFPPPLPLAGRRIPRAPHWSGGGFSAALIGCPVDSHSPPASSVPIRVAPRPANRIITNHLPRVHATRPSLGAATWTQPPLQQCTRGHSMTWRLPRALVHSATPPAMHTCTFRDLAPATWTQPPSSITRGDSVTWHLPRGLSHPPAMSHVYQQCPTCTSHDLAPTRGLHVDSAAGRWPPAPPRAHVSLRPAPRPSLYT